MEPGELGEARRRLDEARGLAERAAGGEGVRRALDDVAHDLEWAERVLKKSRLDFHSFLEMAGRINAQGLQLERIEGYVRNLIRGRLCTARVILLREGGDADKALVPSPLVPARGLEDVAIGTGGEASDWLLKVAGPFLREDQREALSEHGLLERLRAAGIEVVVPVIQMSYPYRRGALKGLLLLGERFDRRPYEEADLGFLRLLGEMLAIALHNALLYYQSTHDALTRLYSRGYFDLHLTQELARVRRARGRQDGTAGGAAAAPDAPGAPDACAAAAGESARTGIALLLADVDHFKSINDRHGHPAGDDVLRQVARALRGGLRDYDIVARYGGEEFALILPDLTKTNALAVAERLRSAVERLAFPSVSGLRVTVSIGVAEFPDDADGPRDLLRKADAALYRAKDAGRNRIVAHA